MKLSMLQKLENNSELYIMEVPSGKLGNVRIFNDAWKSVVALESNAHEYRKKVLVRGFIYSRIDRV